MSLRSGSASSSPFLPSVPRPVQEKSRCPWTLREKLRAAGPRGLPGTGGSTLSTWVLRLREEQVEAGLKSRTLSLPSSFLGSLLLQPEFYRQGSRGPQETRTLIWPLMQVAAPTGSFHTSVLCGLCTQGLPLHSCRSCLCSAKSWTLCSHLAWPLGHISGTTGEVSPALHRVCKAKAGASAQSQMRATAAQKEAQQQFL